jgi:hypothetical protein
MAAGGTSANAIRILISRCRRQAGDNTALCRFINRCLTRCAPLEKLAGETIVKPAASDVRTAPIPPSGGYSSLLTFLRTTTRTLTP